MAFRQATRDGTKALICMYSESGGGKTLSALLIARGLAGPDGTIGMIDTENRRGEIYADDPRIRGYLVDQLDEPFSPQAYMDKIDEAEAERIDVLVIDSGSHEWEGIGGVLDMATSIAEARAAKYNREFNGEVQFGDWKGPKTEHKHLIQKLMRCKCHVIICLRAQYKSRQIDQKDYAKYGIDSRTKTTVLRDEYQSPIQEERFIFEMTVHLQMSNKTPGVPIITKCPEMLLPAFRPNEPITVQTGERMRAWYDQGAPESPETAALFAAGRAEAERGTEFYSAWFIPLPASSKRELVNAGEHDRNKKRAAEIDAATLEPDEESRGDDVDEPDTTTGGDRPYIPPTF